MTISSRSTSAPVLMILGSCTSLQFGAALATVLFDDLGSWGTTALRLGIAGLLLLAISRPAAHRFDRRQWLAVIALGVVMGAMNGTFYAAIARIPLGTAVALEFLGPLVVAAILSTRRSDLLWVLLALFGVSMFGIESLSGAALDPIGVVFALVAAVFWGLYVIASAKVGALVPGQGGLAMSILVGALVVLPLGAPGALRGLMDPGLVLIATGTAVLASLLPYTLELAALRRLPRHVFGILLSLEPVVALLAGLLLGQGVSPLRVVAAVLVVGASIGVTVSAQAPATAEAQDAPAPELPLPTHATVTGEMPALDLDETASGESIPRLPGTGAGTGELPLGAPSAP